MNQLDYLAIPPVIYPITKILTPAVVQYQSHSNIPVYEIRKDKCGVVLVDIVFQAGRPQEAAKMVAASCAAMLREGAGKFSAQGLSEEVDFMGATISTRASLDFITIKGICLRKHLTKMLEIIGAILSEPHFNESEWIHFKEKNKERLKVQLAKTDIISYREITQSMYGFDHPYGYNSTPELYDAIGTEELRHHHKDFITASNCQLFIAGDISDKDRPTIDKLCQRILAGGKSAGTTVQIRANTTPSKLRIKAASNQTSIRLGRMACTRHHPDFDGLNYICNILGGYFGSRLIARLREEKGLTYSIYCLLDTQLYDGDIMISTEVANENVTLCLEEIYREIEILKNDLVKDEELEHVNNYMMGNYLNLFDGPFNSIRAIKSLALAQIPLDDLDSLIKSSLAFDAYQVRDMSQKYFDRNDFWEVIVGTPQE